jgi:hypothetical protein
VGVEPTSAALQAAAWPSGPSVNGQKPSCPRQESNPALDLRRVVCISVTLRGHSSESIPTWTRTRAQTFGGSDAIRYTIGIHVSRAEAQGFEPCTAALETAYSPRSTPLSIGHQHDQGVRGDLNPPPSPSQGGVLPITPRTPSSEPNQSEWSRVDSNHRFSPRQRDVFAARPRDHYQPVPRPGFEPGTSRSRRGCPTDTKTESPKAYLRTMVPSALNVHASMNRTY